MSGFTFEPPDRTGISGTRAVGSYTLTIRAEGLRQTYSGLHARLELWVGNVRVHSDTFNVERDKDRHDFANRLYGVRGRNGILGDTVTGAYDQAAFEHELSEWVGSLWERYVCVYEGELRGGDLEPRPVSMLIDGYVEEGGGTVLFGPPKANKTYTALLWAVSIDAGVRSVYPVREQRRVLYINIERDKRLIDRRLGLVNRVLGLEPGRPIMRMDQRGQSLKAIYEAAQRTVERNAIDVVLLDSLSRAGFGDLNGNQEANESMDMLNRLCPTWIAVGHTPSGDDEKLFGSQMFRAAFDIGVNCRAEYARMGEWEDKTRRGVLLTVRDANDISPPDPLTMVYEFDLDFGLTGVRVKAHTDDFPGLDGERPRTNLERVMQFITAFGPATVTQISRELGINKGTVSDCCSRLLNRGDIYLENETGSSTSRRFVASINVRG